MRRNRTLRRILPCLLALLLLVSGCTNMASYGNGATSEQVTTASEPSGTGETTQIEVSGGDIPGAEVYAGYLAEAFATPVKISETLSEGSAAKIGRNLGGIKNVPTDLSAQETTEEQKSEITRAMRAYTNKTNVEIINNAKSYYVYDKLNKEEKAMYDAFYVLAQDPTTSDNYVSFQTNMDIQGEEFWDEIFVAEISLVYDHPELWWMYPFSNCTQLGYYLGSDIGGYNGGTLVYVNFYQTYNTFESDVKAFNQSVDSILSKINRNAGDEDKAQAIHDVLIDLCTYDNEVLEKDLSDKAHTAFGAIVRNSRGTANYCVCDGYAQAYLYLLQQVGIEGAVVIGMAGNAGADGGMGAHAWSLVNLNGVWYEVDACWDDYTDYEDTIAEYYTPGTQDYQYEMEVVSNREYMFKACHCMYGLSTAEIQDYKVPSDLVYTTRDGRCSFSIMGDSQRWRMNEDNDPNNAAYGVYDACLPIARNTLDRNTLRSDGSQGSGGSSGGTSEGGNSSESGSGGSSESTSSTDTTEVRGPLYQLIAGSYYVSAINGYDEAFLKKNYGNDYYKQLSMFDLRTDASGTLYENGTSAEFYYVFDGATLCMYSATMGMTFLYYDNGKLTFYDYYGNTYIFSRR